MDSMRMPGVHGMMGWICPVCGSGVAPQLTIHCASTQAPTEPQDGSVEHVVALSSKARTSTKNRFQYNDIDFNKFWDLYPRRVGKEAAARTWQRLIVAGVEPQTLIDGARDYAAQVTREGTEQQYVKYPQGWLNDGRFLDAIQLPPSVGETDPAYTVGTPEYEARMVAEGVW